MKQLQSKQNGQPPALILEGGVYHWTAFRKEPKKEEILNEVNCFAQLENIVKAITVAAALWIKSLGKGSASTLTQHFRYKNNGNRIPSSVHRDNHSRPDCFFLVHDAQDSASPSW